MKSVVNALASALLCSVVAAAPTPSRRQLNDHHHADGKETCQCAAVETVHPFSLSCTAPDKVQASVTKLKSCQKTEAACDAKESGVMKCTGAYMHLVFVNTYCGNSSLTAIVNEYKSVCDACLVHPEAEEEHKLECVACSHDDHDHRRRLGDDHDHPGDCAHDHTWMYIGIALLVATGAVFVGVMFFAKKGCFAEKADDSG